MRLISGIFNNYCQYQHKEVVFSSGLTAVLGRNGSGKSNMMKGIYAAISGDFGRNDGLKTDNICQYAAASDQSNVSALLEHGSVQLNITRGIRPNTTRLVISTPGIADNIITKSQEATDTIMSILGVSSRMLADYVFVDQWSIFDFLSTVQAERAKAFQRLFRTEKAEQLWKIIGDHSDKIILPTPGIDRDTVRARLAANEQRCRTLKTELSIIQPKLNKKHVQEAIKIMEDWRRLQDLDVDITRLAAQLVDTTSILNTVGSELARLSKLEAASAKILKDTEESYMAATYIIPEWETYERTLDKINALNKQLDNLTAQPSLVPPEKPVNYIHSFVVNISEESKEFWDEFSTLNSKVTASEHFIQLLTEDTPYCPTCGTPANILHKYKDKYAADIVKARQRLDVMQEYIVNSDTYNIAARKYEETIVQKEKAIMAIKGQLDYMTATPRPDKSKDALIQLIETVKKEKANHLYLINESRRYEHTYQSTHGTHSQIYDEMMHKSFLQNEIKVTKEMADEASKAAGIYKNVSARACVLEEQIRMLTQFIADDMKALTDLQEVERVTTIERDWLNRCKDMRAVVHRDNLPAKMAKSYLDAMEHEINKLLVRFDSPFMVASDAMLSFVAMFKDGRRIPAARLSGGEKVLLAIAFRVVVNDLFAKDLGILCLDEPTAGLDDGNLTCLKIAIERLKELSASRGLQIIMITHEKELSNLFDHVIEVGSA